MPGQKQAQDSTRLMERGLAFTADYGQEKCNKGGTFTHLQPRDFSF